MFGFMLNCFQQNCIKRKKIYLNRRNSMFLTLRNKEAGHSVLYFDMFYLLFNFTTFVIIIYNLFKYVTITAQPLQ